jgi:hypothetical protein
LPPVSCISLIFSAWFILIRLVFMLFLSI